jgi:hypothetical protein
LRQHGLRIEDVQAFVLPATGPRWLVAAGFDRALLEAGLGRARTRTNGSAQRTLLLGASAGAWRSLTLVAKDPARAQRALIDRYCSQAFVRSHSPEHISAAYRELLAAVVEDADVRHALEHPTLDLAMSVVRARTVPAAWLGARHTMLARLVGAAALNLLRPEATHWFFERVIFHAAGAAGDPGGLLAQLAGRRAPLTEQNLRAAALASGTVPLYMQPVPDLEGAHSGEYLDGGLADYHFNQRLRTERGIILMFSHQARVVPGWFDKSLPWRRSRHGIEDLVVVHPDASFISSLPGGRVPTRDDFWELEHAPEQRIARWQEVAYRSDALGEALLKDLRDGSLERRIEPLA